MERGSISDRIKARGFEVDDLLKCGDLRLQLGTWEVIVKMGSIERKLEMEKVIKRESPITEDLSSSRTINGGRTTVALFGGWSTMSVDLWQHVTVQ